jgi:hypothetical protein
MAAPTPPRTWVHEWPTPGGPSSGHTATLLMNDEVVATAGRDDWLAAAHNLRELLRQHGMPLEGHVLAAEMFEQLFQYRQSRRP